MKPDRSRDIGAIEFYRIRTAGVEWRRYAGVVSPLCHKTPGKAELERKKSVTAKIRNRRNLRPSK